MNDLSPEARLLVSAGRRAFEPTEAERLRLMAAVTGAATLSAGLGAATGAQRIWEGVLSLAHAARWAVVVAVPVAAAGAVGLHVMQPSPAHEASRLSAVRPATTIHSAAAAASPLPVAPASSPSLASEPALPPERERSAPSIPETKRDKAIRQEVALLSRAQTALSGGRPQEALAALAEHAQRFPKGVLTEERVATRARTLCALGRTQEAQAELKLMAKLNPTSGYLARARQSCGLP